MSIPVEKLNAMLVANEVHTGCYLSHQRKAAVVVRVTKEGTVHFLRLDDKCSVVLEASFREKFLADYPIELYQYPALRAIRKFYGWVKKEGIGATPEARKVINAILVR
jgi:hypothetical protein